MQYKNKSLGIFFCLTARVQVKSEFEAMTHQGLTSVPVWFWLSRVVPPLTPTPPLERLQLLLTLVTGLGVLTVLLLSEWLLLLLLMVWGVGGEEDVRLLGRPCRLEIFKGAELCG